MRPGTGRLATARSLMVVEVCVLAVSTVCTAETVMVSLTPETFIFRSRLADCPTVSANSSCLTVAKPDFETESV